MDGRAENVPGVPRGTRHGPELAAGKEAVGALMDRCHEESLAIFEGLTPADMAGKSDPGGHEIYHGPSGSARWWSTRPIIAVRST
ncbi:MAG: hypothetical protein R2909_04155 [Gemmatimonadales bacterium]